MTNPTRSGVRDSTCRMCDNGCPTRVHTENGKITRIEMTNPDVEKLCPRWKAQMEFIYHPDRLLYPLKRTGERGEGKFNRVSWDEALDTVVENLLAIKAKWGPEAVVFYIAYPKEPRPYFQRLAHAFGSPNYCTESSNCFTSAFLATGVTYGQDYRLGFEDQNTEYQCKVIWSSSIRNSMPSAWRSYMDKPKETKLIVVDPRRTSLAEMADIHLQLRPGTDGALALGMLNVIIQNDLYDAGFIEKWTVGFDELKELTSEYTPHKAAEITGVPGKEIIEAAEMYATSKPAQLRTSISATTHSSNGFQNHRAILMLPAVTGNVTVPSYGSDRPKAKDITLGERMEQMPPGLGADRFPLWTSYNREMQSNVLAGRIKSDEPYPIKGLFAAGFNATFFPNTRRFLDAARRLDFIVVNEYFHNSGTLLADVVLPIASWLERPVLSTIPGREAKLVTPIIEPAGESRWEWDIYAELAERLGFGDNFWNGDFEKCMDEVLEPMGLTATELKQHPEGLEARTSEPEGEKRTGFRTPSGAIELKSSIMERYGYDPLPVYREPAESPFSQPETALSYPLVLTSGARSVVYTHSQGRQLASLQRMMPEPAVDINPRDAAEREVNSGDEVEVSTLRGTIRLKAHITDNIKAGVVSLPYGWPEANVNALIDDAALDPVSGFAPFKAQLCQIKLA